MPLGIRRHATRLRNFWGRPAADKILRLEALAVLIVVRGALRGLSFARVKRLLERGVGNRPPERKRGHSREAVINAVQAAADDVRGTDCLTQALGLRFLLARRGYAADVHVGVARAEDGRMLAHAWVESGSVTALCGTADLSRRATGAVLDFDL